MMRSIRITKRLIRANINKAEGQQKVHWQEKWNDLAEFERESKTDR
ncbi:MAG: hypothetical protein GOVbin1096_112 [Prokaryotic dsDNA virus sp.]|nr:MAG: hypothetical protein GOVbin1096_112 [Prokaryotic dsDNA virus sp.]